ncbi:MAG: M12 family metallopeptidase [Acetobacteraceae bacterium]
MGLCCLKQHRWRGGVIPYTFDDGQDIPALFKELIVGNMKRWERLTGCIHFVPWRNEADYVRIGTVTLNSTTAGCVGRRSVEKDYVSIGGMKKFTLGGHDVTLPGYPKGIRNIPHELGHIIGLEHEHYRRDSRLEPQALPPAPPRTRRSRFAVQDPALMKVQAAWDSVDGAKFMSVPVGMYDLQSIMHYECPEGWQWKTAQPQVATLPAFGYLNVPSAAEVAMGTWRPSICDIYTIKWLYA